MKKITAVVILMLLTAFVLCACVKTEEPVPTPTDVPADEPVTVPQADPYEDVINSYLVHDGMGSYRRDLDGNGTEELFIGSTAGDIYENQIISAMYTLTDGQPVMVFESGERDRFYISENGTIAEEGSNSAYNTFYKYYTYSNGELLPIFSVGFDLADNKEQPWYRTDGADETRNPIEETDAMSVILMYQNSYQNLPYVN